MPYGEGVAEEKTAGRPLGATGTTVRKNIRRIRNDLSVSLPELSSRLKRFDRPIPPLGISRIESGQRRVDVDDLMAFAAALGVSPATLLMPAVKDDDSDVEVDDLVSITGWQKPITAGVVWGWITAGSPPVHGTLPSFAQHAWPVWIRKSFEAVIAEAAAAMAQSQMQPDVQEGIAQVVREFYRGGQVPVGDD